MGHKWKKSNVPPRRYKSEWIEGVSNYPDAERLVKEVWHHAIEDPQWFDMRDGTERAWYSGSTQWQSLLIAQWYEKSGRLWIRHRLGFGVVAD